MDSIKRMMSNEHGLSLVYVDVTETAKELEQRHLSGPACSEVLGHALAATAFLSTRLKGEKEKISFQLKTDGPVGGVLVEASHGGELRGYTDIKLLDDFDGRQVPDIKEVMGSQGVLSVMHSSDSKVIYSGQISVSPADIRTVTARYFNQSEQIPTGVELYYRMMDFRINRMAGLMVQKMPGADTEKFVEVLEMFESGEVREKLGKDMGADEIGALFKMKDLDLLDTKELKFRCRCSYEKSVGIMGTLSNYELQEIIRSKEPQKVTCHFCGETYIIKSEDLHNVLMEKADTENPA